MLDGITKDCVNICTTCSQICLETITHCLEHDHTDKSHISLLQLCSEICHTSAKAMLMGSPYHVLICKTCEEICEACQEDCNTYSEEFMKKCADICRKCADSCREMSLQLNGEFSNVVVKENIIKASPVTPL